MQTRRIFLSRSSKAALAVGAMGVFGCNRTANQQLNTASIDDIDPKSLFFDISLAQWSLNKALFSGKLDNLDFAAKAKNDFDIDAIEYVNQFFIDKAEDKSYLAQMKQRADDNGVKSLLIMIDREGGLGDTDEMRRKEAVEKHYKWVDAANYLGCHSIRVNTYGEGSAEAVAAAAVKSLTTLSEYGKSADINVIVENHGGYSSDGVWLSNVMKEVNMDNCGTLPDFGNFCIKRAKGECAEMYDRYKGMEELMDYAKAVSAKANKFDAKGEEAEMDYMRIMKTVKDHGYRGYVGIEYEGKDLTPDEGIRATKNLLLRVGKALS
jgi:sugar phosphate isomerase/epimerase